MAAEQFFWVTPTGPSYRLDSNIDGVSIVESVDGRFMPAIRRTDEIVPLQAGSRLRSVLHDQRELSLGLYFIGTDDGDLRQLVRLWLARFDPARGDGKLQVTDPSGGTRELTCRYQDGLGLTEDASTRDPKGAQLAVVTFEANDPYWADVVDTAESWTAGTPTTFFPIFPLRLGASQVFGTSTVTNDGDVETFPVWTIVGPGSLLVLTNHATGRVLAWNGTLGAGETLTIDGRPGNQSAVPKSVVKNDGSNQFGVLSAWDFWPFVPGANEVEIELAGATGASQVTASWRNRFLGV